MGFTPILTVIARLWTPNNICNVIYKVSTFTGYKRNEQQVALPSIYFYIFAVANSQIRIHYLSLSHIHIYMVRSSVFYGLVCNSLLNFINSFFPYFWWINRPLYLFGLLFGKNFGGNKTSKFVFSYELNWSFTSSFFLPIFNFRSTECFNDKIHKMIWHVGRFSRVIMTYEALKCVTRTILPFPHSRKIALLIYWRHRECEFQHNRKFKIFLLCLLIYIAKEFCKNFSYNIFQKENHKKRTTSWKNTSCQLPSFISKNFNQLEKEPCAKKKMWLIYKPPKKWKRPPKVGTLSLLSKEFWYTLCFGVQFHPSLFIRCCNQLKQY